MRRYTFIFLAVMLFLPAHGRAEGGCPKMFEGMSLVDLSGKPATLRCDSQKVLIINLWATWCAPCRLEIMYLIDLYRDYKSQGLEIVGVSLDSMRSQSLKPFVDEMKINYPVYLGKTDQWNSKAGVAVIPATFIIDGKGALVKTLVGFHTKDELMPFIRKFIQREQDET